MNKRQDDIKSESSTENATLEYLRQQIAKLEAFAYNFKNNNEEYVEVIKSMENKISDFLSNKKTFLKIAIISIIESMRSNPDKYSSLIYHNNYNQKSLSSSTSTKDNNSNLSDTSRQVVLPLPPYDGYIIEHYKDIMLEEAKKLYNDIVGQILCEVINESVTKQSTGHIPSLPALSLEEGGVDDDKQN